MNILEDVNHLLPVAGVNIATAAANICYAERTDLTLIELAPGSTASAVFTQNAFCAAPVTIAKQHLKQTAPRYLLVNAGNANAGTGQAGIDAAMACCESIASELGCEANQVLPFSTGVIGENLPVDKIKKVIPDLKIDLNPHHWMAAANAIMTTDTVPKGVSCQVSVANQVVTITGIAKGVGMIRPDMATMLAYITTDAKVEQTLLDTCLTKAVAQSLNRITVDGDTSTNDACVLVATGQSKVAISELNIAEFQQALDKVFETLAKALVRDGEGATKLITINVSEAQNTKESDRVAYTVAHSPLVKTAFFASDPNWGRILAAIGRAGVKDLDVDKLKIFIGDVCIVENGGRSAAYSEELGQNVMNESEITIHIQLNRGQASSQIWTCDFSYDYVKINAEYRS
ncbi:Glutamate N-acetyltransferase @ N-acetylglutamate synthase [hydrothermal vent metagenome]|uniref:glutamate N-acetyltransferase n=1 Tax=hydrothermal vent metagenome TaxID=652676 RepID=A0A3B1AGQ2_9ZZZZ